MSEGRARLQWEHTSAILASIHNHAYGVEEPLTPTDANPFTELDAARQKRPDTSAAEAAAGWAALKTLVEGGRFR